MPAIFQINKGILVSSKEAKELYKILNDTEDSKKSNVIKSFEESLKKYIRG